MSLETVRAVRVRKNFCKSVPLHQLHIVKPSPDVPIIYRVGKKQYLNISFYETHYESI